MTVSKPMNILIAADTFFPHTGGAGYFAQRLAYYLQRRGHTVHVIAPSRGLRREKYELAGSIIWGARSLPVPAAQGNFRVTPSIGMGELINLAFDECKPAVVHVQSHFVIGKAVLAAARRRGIPTVGTNHFTPESLIPYFHLPTRPQSALRDWAWKKFRDVFESIDVVTAPTAHAASLLKTIGLQREVFTISNGVDRRRFSPKHRETYLHHRYRLPLDERLLLTVGRLDREKNIDLLIRAMQQVPERLAVHFAIAGTGPEEMNLRRLACELGIEKRVTFTGGVPDDDLSTLYASADCFITAGADELQSLVTMEAMASALPAIGVDAKALPELIHPDINGMLFAEGNVDHAAQAINKVFESEARRKQMAQQSLSQIAKHEIEDTITQFENVYKGLAPEKEETPPNLEDESTITA